MCHTRWLYWADSGKAFKLFKKDGYLIARFKGTLKASSMREPLKNQVYISIMRESQKIHVYISSMRELLLECGKYLREETIQGRKLLFSYFLELMSYVFSC